MKWRDVAGCVDPEVGVSEGQEAQPKDTPVSTCVLFIFISIKTEV